MISSVLVIVPFLAGINALNDWSVPCTSGECSYDLPTANSSASGSVKIWGSNNAISDVTKAADWQILGCDPNALSQDIRLVCMNDPDDPNSKCGHLYQEIGAVNKIVRLPEDCGASAFARVAKSWVPDDQSIPTSVRRSLVRRDGKAPVVKALALDTNFDSVDYSKTGPVNIAIQAANVPGVPTDIQTPSSRRARSTHRRFSIKDALGSVKDGIDNAASSVGDAAKDAVDGVKDAADAVGDKAKDAASKVESVAKSAATKVESKAKDAATKVASVAKSAATKVESKAKDAATKVESVAKGAATKAAKAAKTAAKDAAAAAKAVADNNVNVNKTFALKPLNFDKSVNLIDSSINCGKVSASLQVDMDANANAQATISVAATGTLAPPKLTSFGAVAGMTANVAGTMTMTADITGHVDSGKIQLVNLGIPGLDFPGILTVGPSFTVSAQVVGDVDVVMDMTVGINFDVNNAQLAFPPDDKNKPASSAFSIGDTPLTLNAAPDVTATGTLTAHLIPSLNLGVSALGGKAKAQIFLDLDTNASLEMNLDGSASATKVIDNSASSAGDDNSADATNDGTTEDTTEDGSTEEDGEAVEDGSEDDQATLDPDTLDNSADSTDDTETDDTATDDPETADDSSSDLQPVFVNSAGQLVDGDGNPVQTSDDDGDASTTTDDSDSQDTTEDDSDSQDTTEDDSDSQDTTEDDSDSQDTTEDDSDSDETTDSDAQDDSEEDEDSVQKRKAAKDTKGDSADDSQDADTADSTDETTDDTSSDTVDDSSDTTADGGSETVDDGSDETTDDTSSDTVDDSSDGSETVDDGSDETTDDTSSDTVDDSSDTTDNGIDTTKSLGGCVNVNGAISVNAGAEGSFFGLFDKFANAQLFNKNFKIFSKCFGDQATGAATDNSTAVDDGTTTDSTDEDSTDTDSTDSTADDSSETTDATSDSTDPSDDSSVDDTSDDSATTDDSTTDSSRKRMTRRFAAPSSLERRIALTCPLASSSKKLGVTKGTVKSSSIKSSTA